MNPLSVTLTCLNDCLCHMQSETDSCYRYFVRHLFSLHLSLSANLVHAISGVARWSLGNASCSVVLAPSEARSGAQCHYSQRLQREEPPPQSILWLFFRDHPGEPVPEDNFWTLRCKGRLTEAGTPTIQLGATLSGLTIAHLHHPPIFFTGRMPFLPPNQRHQSTEGKDVRKGMQPKCLQTKPYHKCGCV